MSKALSRFRFKEQCSQFKNKVVQKGQQNPNSANHQQRKSVATSFTSWPFITHETVKKLSLSLQYNHFQI